MRSRSFLFSLDIDASQLTWACRRNEHVTQETLEFCVQHKGNSVAPQQKLNQWCMVCHHNLWFQCGTIILFFCFKRQVCFSILQQKISNGKISVKLTNVIDDQRSIIVKGHLYLI